MPSLEFLSHGPAPFVRVNPPSRSQSNILSTPDPPSTPRPVLYTLYDILKNLNRGVDAGRLQRLRCRFVIWWRESRS